MKLLISCVVALLCMQTTLSTSTSQCEKKLKESKKEIRQFLKNLDKQYQKCRDQYLDLQKVCDDIASQFTKLSDGCHQSPQEKECQVAKFLESFFELRITAVEHMTKLILECVKMFNMADEFKCEEKLICIVDKTCSGCEAETNALGCDLLGFIEFITAKGVDGRQHIIDLLDLCDQLANVSRKFSCEYGPSCSEGGCSCGTDKNSEHLLAAIEEFRNDSFGPVFNEAHESLLGIKDVCDVTGDAIESWKHRF